MFFVLFGITTHNVMPIEYDQLSQGCFISITTPDWLIFELYCGDYSFSKKNIIKYQFMSLLLLWSWFSQ